MRDFLFPSQFNNFTPHLLSRKALIAYILCILSLQIFFGAIGLSKVSSAFTINELVTLQNSERSRNSLNTLSLNPLLSSSAQKKAEIMVQTDCWSHYCPQGEEPWIYFREVGYRYEHAGENLAEGFNDAERMVNAWMNSPTHRDNILNQNFNEVGIGIAFGDFQGKKDNVVIVVHFGKSFSGVVAGNDISVSDTRESSLTIDTPKSGSYLRSNQINIQGRVFPPDQEVSVKVNDAIVGSVFSQGENYTFVSDSRYSDGEYVLQTETLNQKSNKVQITFDGDAPRFIDENTLIIKKESSVEITITVSTDVDKLETIPEADLIEKQSDSVWKITINNDALANHNTLEIIISDKIGQEGKVKLENLMDTITFEESQSSTIIPIKLPGGINNKTIYGLVAGTFILYISILLIIDFVVLKRTQMLTKVSRKPHISLSIFIILFIIVSFGGLSGSLLTEALSI